MMIVGLTGGIGSGKSTVAKMFTELGIPVYDSDGEAKRVMNASKKVKKAIIELLGAGAYTGDELNRRYVASKVFTDETVLQKLNDIVHPAVRKHFLQWTKKQDAPYVIQESAIIFENKNQDFYDTIVLITAPLEDRIQRIIKRDQTTRENVLSRIANQLSDDEKENLSDFMLINEDIAITRLKTKEIHDKLIQNSKLI
ncbi:dephospho-CoA kinase [Cellulophaga sp. F20128]|uniref:dephospho-CoA kinase n=1 Tax=Cellulophaga sp. F20128 TaxID=2926413 RepID=UPI001FF1A8D8|nr:dephospho-CoA kinase [Cellulophaga sp. F20128]MCK0157176.1 dephospho-CoA kinase [Cellulophaga sp. F20128]